MIQFFSRKVNIPILLLLCLNFLLLPVGSSEAQNFLLDIDSFKILKDDTSSDFFIDLQNISSRAEYIQKSVALIDPGYLKHLRPDTAPFQKLIKNQNIIDVLKRIEKNQLEDAAASLKAVNNFSGKYPYLLYLDGWIQFKQRNYIEAVKKFSLLLKAYDGYGHSIEVSLLNAISYSRLGDFTNSLKFFNRALTSYRDEIQAVKEEQVNLSLTRNDSVLLKTPELLLKNEGSPDIFRRLLLNQQVVKAYRVLWFINQAKERLLYNKSTIAKAFVTDPTEISRQIAITEKEIRAKTASESEILSLKEHLKFLKELSDVTHGKGGNKKNIAGKRINTVLEKISLLKTHIFQAVRRELTNKYEGVMAAKDTLPAWINFYISRIYYKDYLKKGRPVKLLSNAVGAHAAYIRDYKNINFLLTRDVVNRLIDLRYDLEGFSGEIVSLYQILIDSRFAKEAGSVDARFELGTAYYNEGMYWKASEVFKDFRKHYPETRYTPAVLFLTGELLLKKGEREEALAYFNMASSHINTYFALPSLYRRGWLAEKMEEPEQAVRLFSKVLLYIEEFKKGMIDIAVPEEKSAIEALSDNIFDEAVTTITNNLYENGKTAKLFEYFNDYRNASFLPRILVSFSQVYRQQRDYVSQIELYKRFLLNFPEKHIMPGIFAGLLSDFDEHGLTRYSENVRNILISFYDDENYSAIDRSMFRELVADCYVKSAAYHRSIARKTKDLREFEKAVQIYREYLNKFNDQKNIVEVNLRLARLLSETGDDAGAGIEYTKAAWEYPHKETKNLQQKAALASVDSLYRHIKKNRKPSQKILNLFYLSAELFVSVFPDSIDSTKVLYFVGDKQFIEKDYESAIETFSKIIEMAPDRTILLKSMQRLALAHFYSEKYLEAKTHFQSLMTYILTSALPDSSERGNILYKVGDTYYSLNSYDRYNKSLKNWKDGVWLKELTGELWNQIKILGSTDNIYQKYERKFAQMISPFREEDKKLLLYSQEMVLLSTLNLSNTYIQEKRFSEAIKLLFNAAVLTKKREAGPHYLYRAANLYKKKEELKTAYSIFRFLEKSEAITRDKKYKYPVLMQLASISDKLKKQHDLVDNLLKVADLNEIDSTKKLDAVAKAGFAYQSIGNHEEALKTFERFMKAASPKTRRYQEISFRTGKAAEKLGLLKKARKYYQKALKSGGSNTDPEKEAYYSAASGFKINELDYRNYKKIARKSNIKKYLVIKQKKMNELIKAYDRTIKFGILEFTSASYYRIGSLYEDFASEFTNSPIPSGLTLKQKEQYKRLLTEKIKPLKDKAVQIHGRNLKLLREKKFNKWIEMSLVSYSRLNSLFTIKNEQIVEITDIVAPLSLKRSEAETDKIEIPGFEALPDDSLTSNVY